MVTLTYSGDRGPSDAREDLRRWAQQVRRLAARDGVDWCCIWRVEQTRAGRVHFHCLVWESRPWRPRADAWRTLAARARVRSHAKRLLAKSDPSRQLAGRRWALQVASLTEAWVRYSEPGQNDVEASRLRSVDVRPVRNSRHAISYCSKYVAKVNDGAEPSAATACVALTGRHWGVSGARRLVQPACRFRLTRSLTFDEVESLARRCHAAGLEWLAGMLELFRAEAWQFTSQREAWRLVRILTRERGSLWNATTSP